MTDETEARETGRKIANAIVAYETVLLNRRTVAANQQSTSARLRETQTALAASQADLTRVEAELHDALRRAADLEQVREELARAKRRIDGDLMDLQDLTSERDGLVLLNVELKAEAASWRATAARRLANLGEAARALATANYRNRILAAENEAALRRLNEKEGKS